MGIVKMIVGLLVLVALIGGGMWYMGMLKTDASGNVAVDTTSVQKIASDAQKSTTEGYGAANSAFFANKYQDAIRLYREALVKDPSNTDAPQARFQIGKAFEELGQPTEALAAYREYVKGEDTDKERLKRGNDRIAFLENSGTK